MRFLLYICLFICVSGPALAQTAQEKDGAVHYNLNTQEFIICQNGHLDEGQYAALVTSYMQYSRDHGLVDRELQAWQRKNQSTGGILAHITNEQKDMMHADEIAALSAPFENNLSQDQVLKLYVMAAANVMAVLNQKIGPARVRDLCHGQ